LELTVAPDAFEIGQILAVPAVSSLTLETLVPLGDAAIPLVRLHDEGHQEFERHVRDDERVQALDRVNGSAGQHLYAIDWDVADDEFFTAIRESDAHVLDATGTRERWEFRLWFPDHDHVSRFNAILEETSIPIDVQGIYNPTKPDAGPWYGLTKPQRDALGRAVEAGYYDIPRRISTNELADEFDISDQALTERLRRAIATLARNAILVDDE
jgi:predicted DNA binding protein